MAKFEGQVGAAGKNDDAKHAIEVVLGIKADPKIPEGKLAEMMEKVVMGETLTPTEQHISNALVQLRTRLGEKKNLSQAMSLEAFQKMQTSAAGAELQALGEAGFKQGTSSGACVLYSFLYGVVHTDGLRDALMGLLRKDAAGNYYVRDTAKNSIYKISADAIKGANEEMNPSRAPVLRALGLYAFAKFREFFQQVEFHQYIIFHDGKDIFFNKNVYDINKTELLQADFSKTDGSLKVGAKTYSGKFVISIGTTRFNGHAICVFFDSQAKKWKIYDNIIGKVTEISELSGYKIVSAVAVGSVSVH
ncbi:MAG: hypothetical protein ACK5O7_06965 [Holosporales bacterium]